MVSTNVRMITAHNGSEVTNQNGKADSAITKNTQSSLVITNSVLLTNAMSAMKAEMMPETPMGQAPIPP